MGFMNKNDKWTVDFILCLILFKEWLSSNQRRTTENRDKFLKLIELKYRIL